MIVRLPAAARRAAVAIIFVGFLFRQARAFTLATASAPELRAMVKTLMTSKRGGECISVRICWESLLQREEAIMAGKCRSLKGPEGLFS